MEIIWLLSGNISYKNNRSSTFLVLEDRGGFRSVGPDVSTLPEIVNLMTSLGLPTKAPVSDPSITDLRYRFCVLDAETNNNTIEIGATNNYKIGDTGYRRAIAVLSNNSYFVNYFGGNYIFDGTFYLTCSEPTGFSVTNESRSMFGWVKPSSDLTTAVGLFGYGSLSEERSYDFNSLVYNKNNQKNLLFYGDSVNFNPLASALRPNEWNFVGMVYDGTDLFLYVNDRKYNATSIYLDTTDDLMHVGLGLGTYSHFSNLFKGDLSNISIFNEAKDDQYIDLLRSQGRIGYESLPDSLIYNHHISNAQTSEVEYLAFDLQAGATFDFEFSSGIFQAASRDYFLEDVYCSDESTLDFSSGPFQASMIEYNVTDMKVHLLKPIQAFSDGSLSTITIQKQSFVISNLMTSTGAHLEFCKSDAIGPVSYWNMSETSGTRYDSCSAGNDLTIGTMTVDFTPIRATLNTPCTFHDGSYPLADSWLWDFGDGSTSIEQNPTHTFTTLGDYTVKLVVNNKYETTKTVSVSTYLLRDPMDGTALVGALDTAAEYVIDGSDSFVRLTPSLFNTHGAIDYNFDFLGGSTSFVVEFDMYAAGNADAIYWYMYCDSIPTHEDASTNGYIVYFSEYHAIVAIHQIGLVAFNGYPNLGNATWRSVRIEFNAITQHFSIYVNDSLALEITAPVVSLTGTHFGLGARTGGQRAEHRVRNLKVLA